MKIQEITSSANEKIKYLKKLSHKKDRDESRQFVVENLLIIHDAMQAGSYPASIYLTRQIYDSGSDKIRYLLNVEQISDFIRPRIIDLSGKVNGRRI